MQISHNMKQMEVCTWRKARFNQIEKLLLTQSEWNACYSLFQ